MKQNALQAYQDLFSGSQEPVVIYDEHWKILWSNTSLQAQDLHKQLQLHEDCWANLIQPVVLNNQSFLCRLSCSAENRIRIAQFSLYGKHCGFESTAVTGIVQGISSLCDQLAQDLEHYDLQDEYYLLNALSGNALLLYRMNLLRNELERIRAGAWNPLTISMNSLTVPLCHSIKSILRMVMQFDLDIRQDALYTFADATALGEIMTLCIVLSVTDVNHICQTQVTLDAADGVVLFMVETTILSEERADRCTQVRHPSSLTAEKELIERFCTEYGGTFRQQEEDGVTTVCLELPQCEPDKVLGISASHNIGNPTFYDATSALLAPIRYRDQY